MTLTPLLMYIIVTLDSVGAMSAICAALSLIICVCFACSAAEQKKRVHKAIYKWIAVCILCAMTCVFLPTSKQMATILVVPAVANSELVQEAAPVLKSLAMDWLKEQLPEQGGKAE